MVTHEPDIAQHATSQLFMRDGKIQKITQSPPPTASGQ